MVAQILCLQFGKPTENLPPRRSFARNELSVPFTMLNPTIRDTESGNDCNIPIRYTVSWVEGIHSQ